MSNKSNEPNWAARERLSFIETCAWWKGIVNRTDLTDLFGVSLAQASMDIQRYQELNPEAMTYNLRLKRYEVAEAMKCVLGRPRLEEAVSRFMDGGFHSAWPGGAAAWDGSAVAVLRVPTREADEQVARRAFMAILNGQRLRMRYVSVSSGSDDWRRTRPHALGHDGTHWFLRAWCEKNDAFRDFSLSRIGEIEWSREQAKPPQPDHDWQEWVTFRVQANRTLDKAKRQAVELDYGMTDGVLEFKVRKAMQGYLRDRLGLMRADGTAPEALLEQWSPVSRGPAAGEWRGGERH